MVGERRTFGHGGGFPGHITKTMASPDDELVVTALANCGGAPTLHIVRGIYSIIDYFQKNTPEAKAEHNLLHLEGRYVNLWAVVNIVVTGDKVVSVYPGSWQPFNNTTEMEYVNDTTFKTVKVNSFLSEGELVTFTVENRAVESIVYNGMSAWPEAAWAAKMRSKKIISQE